MDTDIKKEKIDNIDNTINLMELSHEDKIKRAEIKLSAYFAECDSPFCVIDDLIPFLKEIFTDSKVVQVLISGQNKDIKNIMIPKCKEIIDQYLQSGRFSILIYEFTHDWSSTRLIILVRHVLPLNKKIVIRILMHLHIDYLADSSTRSKYFILFKRHLEEKRIPIKNIVGMAYDNFSFGAPSVLVGSNSFMQHLKQEVPGLVVLNCISQSFTLVANNACQALPVSCELLMKNIFTYTSDNAKRCALLNEIREFFNLEKKLQTKWIVLRNCVIKILENWEDLKNYFVFAITDDKLTITEMILSQLNDNKIKAYFLFLKYVLNFFDNFNALFQSSKILVHKLFESSQQMICQLAHNFMTTHALKDINDLDVNNEENILNLENIYIGPECENFLETLPLPYRQEIKLTCLNFYKKAIQEMLKRLPYKDPLFEHLTFLKPEIALYYKGRSKFRDLTYIAMTVEHIDITKLAYEWRILPSVFDEQEKEKLASLAIDEMWSKIVEYKNFDEEKAFPNLELLVEVVLSFPYSNAAAEQLISDIYRREIRLYDMLRKWKSCY